MVCRLLEALPGSHLSSRSHSTIVDNSWLYYNLRACIAVSASGGFRRAEISLPAGNAFSAMHMSRASLFFIINKQVVRAPSRQALLGMHEGIILTAGWPRVNSELPRCSPTRLTAALLTVNPLLKTFWTQPCVLCSVPGSMRIRLASIPGTPFGSDSREPQKRPVPLIPPS